MQCESAADISQCIEKIHFQMVFHLLSKNLVLVGHDEELAIYILEPASDQTPVYSGLPLCVLLLPPHPGFFLKDIPHQPLLSSTEDEGLFRSDPEAALLAIHFGFRSQPRGTPLDYVLCIPRATLVARLTLPTASVAGPPAGAVRTLDWEDWTCGGTLLCFSRFTFVELQVATFGSRVAVMSHRVQFDRRLSEAATDVCVFEIHPWARASNLHPRVSGDGLEDIDFTAESEGAVGQLRDSPPFYVSHRAVAQEGDAPPPLDKERMLLLEDGLALLVRLLMLWKTPVTDVPPISARTNSRGRRDAYYYTLLPVHGLTVSAHRICKSMFHLETTGDSRIRCCRVR